MFCRVTNMLLLISSHGNYYMLLQLFMYMSGILKVHFGLYFFQL